MANAEDATACQMSNAEGWEIDYIADDDADCGGKTQRREERGAEDRAGELGPPDIHPYDMSVVASDRESTEAGILSLRSDPAVPPRGSGDEQRRRPNDYPVSGVHYHGGRAWTSSGAVGGGVVSMVHVEEATRQGRGEDGEMQLVVDQVAGEKTAAPVARATQKPAKRCPHGKAQNGYYCKECCGKGICSHGRQRRQCNECGGKGICSHGRVRSQCKECGGGAICSHGRQRSRCKECGN